MDLSSLTEAQQQQLQQLQKQFQEHQAQQQQEAQQQQQYQQQQNQDYASQAYDPSQVQAYDQSSQAYYSYYQYQQPQQPQHHPQQENQPQHHPQQPQQNQPQHQQSEQQYAYYQPDYANAYQQPAQHESVPVQPPGVQISQNMDGSGGGSGQGQGQVQVQHQQNAYYPHAVAERQHQQQQQQQQGSSSSQYPVPPGLNAAAAAAVAALSQLTQFAGTMDAAERAMAGLQERQWHAKGGGYGPMMGPGPFMGPGPMHHGPGPMRPPVGRSSYRGGGRRGGPFRGGGRGDFGRRHPRSGGSGPPFRGKGRGRGRGGGGPRRFPPHGASSTSSYPETFGAEDAESTGEEEEPSAVVHEEAPQAVVPPETSPSATVPGKAASNRRPPQAAWCELCRVDCTGLEILEQHKNGKRHKKTLQRIEELKNANKMGAEIQNEQKSVAESNQVVTLQPENVQEGEENKPTENLPTEAIADENNMEIEQQNNTLEQPAEEASELQAGNPRTDRFDNWKRGIKRKMRGGRGGKHMKTFEAPRRPIEPPIPKVVIPLICDLCNVKCDTQEVFDRHLAGKKHITKLKRFEGHQAMYGPMVQALYPPNPIAQTFFHPQGNQQAFYGPQGSFPSPAAYIPPQAYQAAPAAAGSDTQFQQNPNPQGLESTPESGGQNSATLVPEAQQQQQVGTIELEAKHAVTEMNPVNGILEYEGKELNHPSMDNTITGTDQGICATHEADPLPDYGATASSVILPGLEMQAKEGGLAE